MDEPEKKSDIAKREEETLAAWQEQGIFEKSLAQTKGGEGFVFYDGPPFATGLPHYGSFLTSIIKDALPRYKTMQGRYVRRVWGWDCHGLPIENLIEGELGLAHKKDIEEYGVENFNEAARASVLRYDTEWKKMIPRLGRWIDMKHAYRTMDANYTESIWWAFKTLHDKDLVYQGFKSMHICPRCETTLSNNEVSDGYKDITDISVTVKFALVEEPKTYLLAWTTTPWTLPGNVALAVNPDEEYIEVSINDEKYIVAKARVGKVFEGKEYRIIKTVRGADLVGRAYKPLFDYYASQGILDNRENGWKVYGTSFVTMESGTGIVHIAPAFGEDDMVLGTREKLPFVQHVGMDGLMKPEVRDFVGIAVKPKGDHQATDILIIKHLAGIEALFSKEKIIHAYPHCWRCDTPLLNYAAGSWFVRASELKGKLLAENAKTSWVPKNMRDGRFGKWLENARDWAISRSRYWGAPLPVWHCTSCEKRTVIGSRAELTEKTKKSGNRYLVMRHGEASHNLRNIVSSQVKDNASSVLTDSGRAAVEKAGKKLASEHIDLIITSPFVRTKETAEIVAATIGYDTRQIVVDERIREVDTGVFNGRPVEEYRHFATIREKLDKRPEGGENLLDLKRRMMVFIEELEARYADKTILIVTHEYPTWMLAAGIRGMNADETAAIKDGLDDFIDTAGVCELSFAPFPHNEDFEFDLHRPYIDRVVVLCPCGGTMSRTPYVFDCWFESGSMPYAQFHYPFENKELFEKNFPADFIAEGVDQTRGWFYNMLVLSVGLFDKTPFKNVIVNGMVLAEDGQKMSKKLKNYPDPIEVLNRYGADAIRYYMLASPIVHAEDLAFSERGVDEVVKKVIVRLMNVLSFYEMHGEKGEVVQGESSNPLDQWILARLAELGNEMTGSFDAYELDRAVKPIGPFVDDLSTWYIRRSRDRFKSEDVIDRAHAIATTRTILREFSKLLAPVMPFLAEHLYRRAGGAKESVHLEAWPAFAEPDTVVLIRMAEVRRVVSLALEARAKAGIKVRQPLASVTVRGTDLGVRLSSIITDELNIKKVIFKEKADQEIALDTVITPELKREGQFRDLVRTVQELRKKTGLTPSDIVTLAVATSDEGRALALEFGAELKKTALIKDIVFKEVEGELVNIDGISFTLALVK